MAPHQPGILCAVSPSVFVYEDASKDPRQLHWLDCSEPAPKLLGITANTNLSDVQDICVAKLEKETLLIVISRVRDELIHAFNSITGQLKWSVQKKIPGMKMVSFAVTGDGNCRIFVTNATTIQMFSALDGQYLGCFMKEGDQGLGLVCGLWWCEATSSLVAGHHDNR